MCQSICLSRPSLSHSVRNLCRLDHPRLVNGPSRRYTRESFTGCFVPYPGGSKGALSRFFPLDFGLALSLQQVGALQCSAQRLQRGEEFRGCRHFVMLRPPVLLATQVAPTAVVLSIAALVLALGRGLPSPLVRLRSGVTVPP